jgi:hypothetical protein
MKKLLSFKHWQLFLLIIICGAWTSPSPLKEIINSMAVVTFTLWIYAIGVYGQDRIAELGLKTMNVKLFKANVIIVGSLFLIALIYSATQQKANEVNNVTNTFESKDIIYIVAGCIFSLHFFRQFFLLVRQSLKLNFVERFHSGTILQTFF